MFNKKNRDVKTGFVNNKMVTLEGINKLIKRYGIPNVLVSFFMLVFMIFIGITYVKRDAIFDSYQYRLEKEFQLKERQLLEYRVGELNPQVQNILLKLLNRTNACRAFVFEMHNGVENTIGLPFAYFTMTYEELRMDYGEYISSEYTKVNLSKLKLSNYIAKKKHFVGNVDELKQIDDYLAHRFKRDNVDFIAIYPIKVGDSIMG